MVASANSCYLRSDLFHGIQCTTISKVCHIMHQASTGFPWYKNNIAVSEAMRT